MNEKVHALINQQINKEFYSAYLYLNFSNYFEEVGLDGFANWYKIQAQEERDHAMLFYQYLQNENQKVTLEAIDKPDLNAACHMDVLKAGLEHEKYVTSLINDIYSEAYEAKDFRTMQFLDWFVKEQGEELSPKLSAMLNTAIPQVNQYGLYTAKPFDHAYDARQVIDMTMPEVAAQNRAQVQALLDQGVSLEEAAARYDTDEIFKQWYDDTESQLANLAE